MPYLNQKNHILITQYCFVDYLSWTTIVTKIYEANPDQVCKFYTQFKTQHPDALVDELVEIAGQKKT